jgi:hypothetical protein
VKIDFEINSSLKASALKIGMSVAIWFGATSRRWWCRVVQGGDVEARKNFFVVSGC